MDKHAVLKALKTINDPELSVSLWDMGLIYGVNVGKTGIVTVTMTLTSMGCPLYADIEQMITDKLRKVYGVKKVVVNLVFDPPWTPDRMKKEVREQLGL